MTRSSLPCRLARNISREAVLYNEPFYLAVSRRHAKAKDKSVSVAALDNEQVLLLEDGHCLRDQALEVCKSHNAVENTNFRATSLETLRQMVVANVGITLMPELAVTAEAAGVSYIPFRRPESPVANHRHRLAHQFAETRLARPDDADVARGHGWLSWRRAQCIADTARPAHWRAWRRLAG